MKGIIAIAAVLILAGVILFTRSRPALPNPDPTQAGAADPMTSRNGPRLPTPRVTFEPAQTEPEPELPATNLLTRLLHNEEIIRLTPEQVEAYLASNHRSAGSLLAAFRATGDTNLLREVAEKFPHDPMVNFAALFRPGASAEERRQWLDAFKQSAPDNALANFLSAHDFFKAGQNDRAVEELQAALGKNQFQDYSLEFMQNGEEAYRSAGYSDVEAKASAMMQLLLPHLSELKQTGLNTIDLAKSYKQAGDEASAQAALQIALNLSQHLQKPGTFNPLINELVGIAIEKRVLDTMDPGAAYGGQTAQGRIDEMAKYRSDIKALVKQSWPLLESLPPAEVGVYFDRSKSFGELSAMQWVIDKYGPARP